MELPVEGTPESRSRAPRPRCARRGGRVEGRGHGIPFREDFKLRLHGASTIEGSIDVGDSDLDVSGASRLTLIGSARAVRLSASGASHLNLGEFPVQQCEVVLSGASSARLASRSERPFTARLSGASHLEGHADAGSVSLNLGGASVATLRGKANSAVLEAGGSVDSVWRNWSSGKPRSSYPASSQATVTRAKSLKYDLSNGSRLEYLGEPAVLAGKKARGATIHHRP